MKREVLFGILIILSISSILLVCVFPNALAGYSIANNSLSLAKTDFAFNEVIDGSFNLSLANESADSLLKAVIGSSTQTIKLVDFLNLAAQIPGYGAINFSCYPENCSYDYSAVGSGTSSMSVNGEKTLGFKITANEVPSINSLVFSISGNSPDTTCVGQSPIQIDLLNDNETDFEYNESGDWCYDLKPSECYDASASGEANISSSSMPLCEKVLMLKTDRLRLGAKVKKTGTSSGNLMMFVYNPEQSENPQSPDCDIAEPNSDYELKTCEMDYNISQAGYYFICIYDTSFDETYSIKMETSKKYCGKQGLPESLSDTEKKDFALYYQETGYKNLNKVIEFDAASLTSALQEYVGNYANCSGTKGCVIPFRISTTQQISVNATLNTSAGTTTKFYEVNKTAARVNMNYTVVPLSAANFTAPSATGNYSLKLYLGTPLIGTIPITVSNISSLKTQVQTEIINKKIKLQSFAAAISNLSSRYSSFSGNISSVLAGLGMAPNVLNASLISIDNSSTQANPDWTSLKGELDALLIPDSLQTVKFQEIEIPVDSEKISPSLLSQLGAGEAEKTEQVMKNAIASWQDSNLVLKANVEGISAQVSGQNIGIITFFTLKITPLNDLQDVFFAVELPSGISAPSVSFDQNYSSYGKQELSNAIGFKFSSLSSGQTAAINFAILGLYNYIDLGFSASSAFSQLPGIVILSCGNKICEKNLGETTKTCPEDCKPIGLVVWIIIFVAAALGGGYYGLKWYYKTHYEKSLFKNPLDLNNIMSFIQTSQVHGLNEEEIRKKLKQAGWNSEQIDHAFSKNKAKKSPSASIKS